MTENSIPAQASDEPMLTLDQRRVELEAEAIRINAGRAPKFGDWMRNPWAGESNPQRDGMFVQSKRVTGKFNPGLWYEMTDGNGAFWSSNGKVLFFIDGPNTPQPSGNTGELAPRATADHCPACGGSGHSMMLAGGGPDAQEQFDDCVYCGGMGGLLDAYNGTRDLLALEQQKNVDLTCRLALADEPVATPRATADANLREAVGELIKAKGRFHTEQNYAAVVKAYDAATKGAKP